MSVMNRRQPKRAQRAVPILTWLTPVGAIVSVINVALSMCTGEWLKSYERIPVEPPNGTHNEVFDIKQTVSGLWRLCYCISNMNVSVVEVEMTCFPIDYFAKDRYTPDPHDSTMAIPYAVTKAGPLFIVAAILLTTAIMAATLGHVSRSRRVAMFIGGIIFIIAGLIMLIGLVVYLSVLQSEIGPKLRPRNSLEDPMFSYSYGFGFILVVVGFMSTELTGICAIFWYMYWHQLDWAQKATNSLGGATSCNNVNNFGECNYGDSWRQPSHPHRNYHYRHRVPDDGPSHETFNFLGNANNGRKYGWHCDLHYPTSGNYPSDSRHQNSYGMEAGGRKSHCCSTETKHLVNQSGSSGRGFYYDDDFEMDLPLPPPPPLPRDITCTTTVSGDEFLISEGGGGTLGRSKDARKTTPV